MIVAIRGSLAFATSSSSFERTCLLNRIEEERLSYYLIEISLVELIVSVAWGSESLKFRTNDGLEFVGSCNSRNLLPPYQSGDLGLRLWLVLLVLVA